MSTEKPAYAPAGEGDHDPVLEIIERGNQRGGRMLSVIDLIEAQTLEPALCAWILDRILAGSSWLVGASPGGAGKTTVMCALLAMVPGRPRIHVATPFSGWERAGSGECVVAYEISPHDWEGYVWGREVRRMAELGRRGVRIISNLHADTLEEARSQIADECGAGEQGLQAFGMFLPLRLERQQGRIRRVIDRVHYVAEGRWCTQEAGVSCQGRVRPILDFLMTALRRKEYDIAALRGKWITWVTAGCPA